MADGQYRNVEVDIGCSLLYKVHANLLLLLKISWFIEIMKIMALVYPIGFLWKQNREFKNTILLKMVASNP